MNLSFFATAPKNLEPLLSDELIALGLSAVKSTRAGVAFQGTLAQAYRVCLWSRIANRVLLPLANFLAPTPEALYEGVSSIQWDEHLAPTGTFAVEFTTLQSAITHTHFGALKVKDAIVDQFRAKYHTRPNVQIQHPDVQINVHIHHDKATINLDLSGDSLHKRGYRVNSVEAPLKENLAAAILVRAGWPAIAQQEGALIDPLCGSGTLLIEAAYLAGDIAPGLLRDYFGFSRWRQHDVAIWNDLQQAAQQRKIIGLEKLPPIIGYDAEAKAVRVTLQNIQKAGLTSKIQVQVQKLQDLTVSLPKGLLVANPPYGERLGKSSELQTLYACLGKQLTQHCQGWQAAILTGNIELGKSIGLRAEKIYTLYNGALECKLLRFTLDSNNFFRSPEQVAQKSLTFDKTVCQDFINRLTKNWRRLQQWAKQEKVDCFRVYDADLPDYALAIDVYEQWVHIQEYAAPKTIDPKKAETRLQAALHVIPEILEKPKSHLFLKTRQRQKGLAQYQKVDETEQYHPVHEGKAIFLVNFTDYLDTGLFLDQRLTRQMIQSLAKGKRFLNLFGYTGTATVHAALGGAITTTTVDMSNPYLIWARRNLLNNGIQGQVHQLIQAECLTWLQAAATTVEYDLIYLDPPTFSNSKRMTTTLDVQRDHVALIQATIACLAPGGLLLFSTNYQRFKMDADALPGVQLENITAATLPKDFERNPRIHQCWKITRS